MNDPNLTDIQRAFLSACAKSGVYVEGPKGRALVNGLAQRGLVIWKNQHVAHVTREGRAALAGDQS